MKTFLFTILCPVLLFAIEVSAAKPADDDPGEDKPVVRAKGVQSVAIDLASVRVEAPAGKVELVRLTFAKAVEGQPVTVSAWCRDGKFGQAWAVSPIRGGYCFPTACANFFFYGLPREGLKREGGKLTGSVWASGVGASQKTVSGVVFAVFAEIAGGKITGTFAAEPAEGAKGGEKSGGKFTGEVLSSEELKRQLAAIATGSDYPCWRGSSGSGAGPDSGAVLVDDPTQLRVAWKSEDLIPAGYYEGSNLGSTICDIQCGHASPVLAGGRIYQYYFWGAGKDYDAEKYQAGASGGAKGRKRPVPDESWKIKFARRADQVVLCLDAQTGAVLWKTSFVEDGPNISGMGRVGPGGPNSKAASHLTCCVGGGKVFAKGTSGKVYALDAATGKPLWQTEGLGTLTDAVQYADGVVATGGGGLIGLDAATGKQRWAVPGGAMGRSSAIHWTHKGKEYFLTPSGMCIEPKTGKVLWSAGQSGTCVAADEDHMVIMGSPVTCYRITPASATRMWALPADEAARRNITPVIYKGVLYARLQSENPDAGTYHSHSIDLATGKVLAKAAGTKSFSSVVAGDGRVFNCNAAAVFYQLADGPKYCDLKVGGPAVSLNVADAQTSVVMMGSPETTAIYADGRLFSRSFDGIICYDVRK